MGDELAAANNMIERLFVATVLVACVGCAKTSPSHAPSVSQTAAAVEHNPASASDGAVVYITNCSSCHQADGQGVPGAFPPLAANPLVTGNRIAVIAAVKDGLSGPAVVSGKAYSGIMPHWGGLISDQDIADVVTYIRTSWRNQGSPVSVSDVRAVP